MSTTVSGPLGPAVHLGPPGGRRRPVNAVASGRTGCLG